jgi:predicted DNA-binding ribbon-helix-helix protein
MNDENIHYIKTSKDILAALDKSIWELLQNTAKNHKLTYTELVGILEISKQRILKQMFDNGDK